MSAHLQATLERDEGLFFFDPERLARLAADARKAYLTAEPFPHVVIDDLLPSEVAAELDRAFPGLESGIWMREPEVRGQREEKFASRSEEDFPPRLRQVLQQFNSHPFLRFLEALTAMEGLLPDPEIGKALRHYGRGGLLGVHADFNRHKRLRLHRRLNLIYYVNRDWREEWGGQLELWEADRGECCVSIQPLFNRAVIFPTDDDTPHGFPRPVACPTGQTRRSVNMYYYTSERPAAAGRNPHGTVWAAPPTRRNLPTRLRSSILDLTPPALVRLVRSLRARRRLRR